MTKRAGQEGEYEGDKLKKRIITKQRKQKMSKDQGRGIIVIGACEHSERVV